MEKELEALTSLVQRIRKECKALDDNVAAAQEGKVSDDYLAGHFSYVENLFDEYSTMVKETDLQDDRLEIIKREADETYRHICSLRSSGEQTEREVLKYEDQDILNTPLQEQFPDDGVREDDERHRRRVRKPQILTEAEQRRQQTQWEKAVSLGMAPAPGQVITEAQIEEFQLRHEIQQSTAVQIADENRNRRNVQLQSYRQWQQELARQESIGNHHIDMSRDIFNRNEPTQAKQMDSTFQQTFSKPMEYKSSETFSAYNPSMHQCGRRVSKPAVPGQQTQRFESNLVFPMTAENRHHYVSDLRNRPSASLETKAERAILNQIQPQHRYELTGVSQRMGNLSYMMFQRSIQAAGKLDNDALRALTTGSYYISTAYGAARIVLSSKPTASLSRSAHQITGAQLSAQRNDVIRRSRELRSKISSMERQIQMLPDKQTPLQMRQAQRLNEQITALRSQLPGLQKELKNQEWIRSFQHQRTLDQQLIRELSVKKNHKMPTGVKDLQELSQKSLKKRNEIIHNKYGKWEHMPVNKVPEQIQYLKEQGLHIKKQIQLLQGKGTLSAQERSYLLRLRQQSKDIGRQIAELKGLLHSREDLAYVQEKLSKILRKAGKKRQRIVGTALFMRNLALRPVWAGTESNTEWFAKGVSFTTNPRTIRYTKKVVSGTAHAAGKVFQKAAPTADNWIRYQVSQKKTAARKTMKSVKRGVKKAIPSGVKTAAHTATAPIRGAQKIGTGIQNRAYAAKRWLANSRAGMWYQKQRYLMQSAGHTIKKGVFVVKSLALKALVIFVIAFLVAGLIASIAGLLAGSVSTTMILSPQTDSSGKFNLAPYVQIVRSELTAFNRSVDDLRSLYENNPDYDRVEVVYTGTGNNMREILSMMAVRMQQELDTGSNADVEPYLRYLVDASHSYKTSEHHYFCSGCKYRPYIPPGSAIEHIEPQMELYCPGHIDVTITVHACDFDEMLAQDAYKRNDDWQGWNDENITWCKSIFEMDWSEIYSGVGIVHGVTIGTVISAEDEAKIWQYLLSMTGNPFGAAGLMGNLYAESGLNPRNLENSYEELLGYDDLGYTHAVDSGNYQKFSEDWAGYGLAQWTVPDRKSSLHRFAKSQGVSIGSLDMQLAFLQKELTETSILSVLKKAPSVRDASDEVLINFERPADQSESVKKTRCAFGEYFFNKYQLGVESEGKLTQKQIDVIRVATNSDLYGIPADKGMCQAWAAQVYGAAGLEVDGSCCAYHSGMAYGVSDDWDAVPPGAAVYGYAGNQFGHVGIYVGNGLVYHNIGGVAVDSLSDWVRIYDGFAWGWQAGQDLTIP